MLASEWEARLSRPDGGVRCALAQVYGSAPRVLDPRLALLRAVADRFIERFGDRPLRVFRCPGRINLRGMHVDTHGGYLNLMTHQREVIVAASQEADDSATVANVDARFEEVTFRITDLAAHPAFAREWLAFITAPEIQGRVLARRGHWGNYLQGSALSAQHRFPNDRLTGFSGVVGSDLVRGAALSSSTALSVAAMLAFLGCNGKELDADSLILAVRDAEWYTGARGGTSDQAAMILGGQNELVNVVLLADQLDTSQARRTRFPVDLQVLVVNSYTERSLSGAQLVDYTRNRFAYSLAIEIVRQEMRAQGVPEEFVSRADRLSNLSAEALGKVGGTRLLYRLLRNIPETIPIDAVRGRYSLPELDATYERYFGTAPPEVRPKSIGLRGPLLFGLAESERARVFLDVLNSGDYAYAGRLMSIGHDGDRVVCADGTPYRYDISDATLARLEEQNVPIELCPGVYGASSPVLDALVDAALGAGAWGASLTGAGIAGAVLVLCPAERVAQVAAAVRARLAHPGYASLARRDTPLTDSEIAGAAVANVATSCAGELAFRN